MPGSFGPGFRVARYRLDEEVGRGGMAVVYRAYDSRLDRRVALKLLAPQLARDEAFRQRFIRESRTAAAVDHPSIIPIFEAGEASGVLFIAMRFVHGQDVRTLIAAERQLPAARACQIIGQVASALDAAHARGLVHRDVKPANMLLDAAGSGSADHVYLSDFGLSKQAIGGTELTSTGDFLGTLNYVAPEQIQARPVDGRADEYALACSAFAMLTGAPPFSREDSAAVMWAQISDPPPPVTSRRPDLPAAVNDVMARALAKSAPERFATCGEFATALNRACGLEPGAAGAPPEGPGGAPPRESQAPAARGPDPTRPATQAVPAADLAAAAASAAAVGAAPAGGSGSQAPSPAGIERPPGDTPGPPPPGGARRGSGTAGPAAAPAGRATQARPVQHPRPWAASPGRRPPGSALGTTPYPAPGRGRTHGRAIGAIAVAGVALLAAGGYFLLGRGGTSAGTVTSHRTVALTPPGCTTGVAKAPPVHRPTRLVPTAGRPFDVVTAAGFAFESVGNGVSVLNVTRPVPALQWTSPVPAAHGEALTSDRRFLLAAGNRGASVFRVRDLRRGPAGPIGSLTSPSGRSAVEVAVSPDGRFAFVAYQRSHQVGVFNLRRALASGFGSSDQVGVLRLGKDPVGIAASPDGRYLYVTSGIAGRASASGPGTLTIMNMRKAERNPAGSVVRTISNAGCGPSRVITSAGGRDVWVAASGSNALLAYSASKLISDPAHALLAKVSVGQVPLGLAMVRNGSRIIVADSNRDHLPGSHPDLAVVSPAKALAGRPAVVGYLRSGASPRQFALVPRGPRLLVTSTDSAQLESVSLARLP
jgi:serine/threonine-protein kinase